MEESSGGVQQILVRVATGRERVWAALDPVDGDRGAQPSLARGGSGLLQPADLGADQHP